MSEFAVRFDTVGKMYKIYGSRRDNLLDTLGLERLIPRRKVRYREFWALRGIDLQLRRGERLGIIGRNGAGKSTLLRLVTQNIPATEGTVEVDGNVQALLEIGGGLHPEFTGNENIRASLRFFGLGRDEIESTRQEIAGFTELGRFLDQPFKTYSQGMQARLSFGIATAIQPEILIVDEILGAGDAYFFSQSMRRMHELIDGGATVLLVSHSLDQVMRFCDEAIWLDRGRIVMRGASTEVVKAYVRFIREQEDRRLLAKNRRAHSGGFDAFDRDSYTDEIRVEVQGPCDVREFVLQRDDTLEDRVAVGDAQDADPSQSAAILLETDTWSPPLTDVDGFHRRIESHVGAASFRLWFYYADSKYTVDITYRGNPVHAIVKRSEELVCEATLPESVAWRTQRLALSPAAADDRPAISRWRGEGSIEIRAVRILDGNGHEQAVFEVGSSLQLVLLAEARDARTFNVIPAAVLYRADGVLVSTHVGPPVKLDFAPGSTELTLEFPELNLGDGRYLFSVALYRTLSSSGEGEAYDLLDRSYEFEVTGNAPFDNGIVKHDATWAFQGAHLGVQPR